MAVKKIIHDRQRARRVYGFVQRLPDLVSLNASSAESTAAVLNLDWKESVRFATTGSVTLPPGNPLQPIDGALNTLVDGDRILLKDQSTSSENGIYVVNATAGTWDRADDAIPGSSLTCGAVTYIEDGSANQGSKWILSTKVVTVGGSQTWVLFEAGTDWIASGGEMKTVDPVSIGANFPSTIASDVFFYVSGSRHYGAGNTVGPNANIAVFAGDVVISGTLDMVTSDGFRGDMLEISGSAKITTGSLYLQRAGTNDYVFFANSVTGNVYSSGSMFVTGTLAQGFGSQAQGVASQAIGLFSSAPRFGQFSQASSGLSASYTSNTLGMTQYSRIVWTGQALSTDTALYFKGYNSSGTLSELFNLEDGKAYAIKATAALAKSGDASSNTTMFIREAVVDKTSGTVTVHATNDSYSYPAVGPGTWDFIITTPLIGPTDLVFYVDSDAGGSNPFGVDVKGTVSIELTEIKVTS